MTATASVPPPRTCSSGPDQIQRHVVASGVHNFRDLGGYVGAGGRAVRWGRVLRADGLHRLAHPARLTELGVRTVLDLRTEGEFDAGHCAVDGIEVVHLPVLRTPWDPSISGGAADDVAAFLRDRYLEMADEGADAIGEVFGVLSVRDRLPLVFHCSAGKDRTGVVAALILHALGVDDEQIAADYHLTAAVMGAFTEALRRREPEVAEQMALQPPAFLESPPEAIVGFLDGLRDRHGSVLSFLAACGVTAQTLDAVRSNLLD